MEKKVFKKNRYYLFVGIIACICFFGSIIGVTVAYLSGAFTKDNSIDNPYLGLDFIYNNVALSTGISGSITDDAKVNSITVGTNTITGTTSGSVTNFDMPIYLKNVGNIKGKLLSVSVSLFLYDGTTQLTSQYNYKEDGGYFITVNAAPNFTFEDNNNSVLVFGDTFLDVGESIQILSSISVEGLEDTELNGCTFTIIITATIGQENIENLEASI